jgi:hypothetical protein
VIEPISRGVLDTRLRGYDDTLCGEWTASRSLSSGAHSRDPLARNDGPSTQNNSQQIAPASEWQLRPPRRL